MRLISNKKAFTMIELVIVIVIMGVMAFTAYKAMMGSSDKSKIGSGLIKDELGQVRLNALDAKESNKFSDFRDMDDMAYASLFPSNYRAEFIGITPGLNDVQGYGVSSATEYNRYFTVTCQDVFMIQSQAMPDCYIYTALERNFGDLRDNQTYAVLVDCSKSQSSQVKKVMEAKAKAWFSKNYDHPKVFTNALSLDTDGGLGRIDGATDSWGNSSDGIFGAGMLTQ